MSYDNITKKELIERNKKLNDLVCDKDAVVMKLAKEYDKSEKTRAELTEKIGKLQAENRYLKNRTTELVVAIRELEQDRVLDPMVVESFELKNTALSKRLHAIEQRYLEERVYEHI